jgi:hypothetical protein
LSKAAVDIAPRTESLQKNLLVGKPRHDARLDLAGVPLHHLMPRWGNVRAPQQTSLFWAVVIERVLRPVLRVQFPVTTQAMGMRPRVPQRDGAPALRAIRPVEVGDAQQLLSAGLLDGGLVPNARRHQRLHVRVLVLGKLDHGRVGLGEGVGCQPGSGRGLQRRLDTQRAQRLGELLVRHQRHAVGHAAACQKPLLLRLDIGSVHRQ